MANDGLIFSLYPGIKSAEALDAVYDRHVLQNGTNLAFDSTTQSGNYTSATQTSTAPDTRSSGSTLSKEDLKAVFKKAYPLAAQGRWSSLPDWSDNEALDALVFAESGRNTGAKNPGSTAFGLFQFLSGTWSNTDLQFSTDPVIQAAAGMRYVYDRYQTPERAAAFQKATTTKDVSGLPTDLKNRAIKWIAMGQGGGY